MSKLSRVAKYEELRNRLHSDAESEISSKDLTDYANKLNRIDSKSFKPMDSDLYVDHDPIHAKREEYLSNTTSMSKLNIPSFNQNSTFDNEYLDEYINEVKQYNKDQGLLVSDDTGKNILNGIYGDKIPVINKPFQQPKNFDQDNISSFQNDSFNAVNPFSALSDEDLEKTRSDIASEVQNLIKNKPIYDPLSENDNTYDYNEQLNYTNIKGTSLQEETEKIKLQLDEYEDNLDDVEDKIQNTNRILNFILILLIFALIVVLGFVVYWIMLNKGII